MKEYEFDVRLFAIIRVPASGEAEARRKLGGLLDAARLDAGQWPDGTPAIFEASAEGVADLNEVRDLGALR